ncbi:DUF2029 domain-containing protein [Candidatus Sumerlaeota bacterium]|nr:DUF2029 domain-containing protein [Candidatus Sumerlaeota bacterium]
MNGESKTFSIRADAAKDAAPAVSPIFSAALQWAGWAYVAVMLGIHGIYRPMTIHGVDYTKHWLAARAVLEGKSTYLGDWLWLGFNYPQWSAMVTFWLGWFDFVTAEKVWKLGHLSFVLGCWWIGYRQFHPAILSEALGQVHPAAGSGDLSAERSMIARAIERHWLLVCSIMIAGFDPLVASSLYVGQIEPINALLSMALVAALATRRDRLAGVYWAMLCLVKMMPVVLIIPFVLWKRWRIFESWLAFMALYFFLLVGTGRLGYEWFFVHDMMGKIAFEWRWISISLPRFLMLIFLPRAWHEDPVLYNRILLAFLAGMAAIFTVLSRILQRRGATLIQALEIGLLFVPLLSPLLEQHHLAWALPVLFFHLARWTRGGMPTPLALLLAAGWCIVCADYFVHNFMQLMTRWHQFPALLGAMILTLGTIFDSLWRGATVRQQAIP